MRIRLAAALTLVLVWLPRAGEACAVCFSADADNRTAFLTTTVGMTVLPLVMIGSVVYWLRRRVLALESQVPEPVVAAAPPAVAARAGRVR